MLTGLPDWSLKWRDYIIIIGRESETIKRTDCFVPQCSHTCIYLSLQGPIYLSPDSDAHYLAKKWEQVRIENLKNWEIWETQAKVPWAKMWCA